MKGKWVTVGGKDNKKARTPKEKGRKSEDDMYAQQANVDGNVFAAADVVISEQQRRKEEEERREQEETFARQEKVKEEAEKAAARRAETERRRAIVEERRRRGDPDQWEFVGSIWKRDQQILIETLIAGSGDSIYGRSTALWLQYCVAQLEKLSRQTRLLPAGEPIEKESLAFFIEPYRTLSRSSVSGEFAGFLPELKKVLFKTYSSKAPAPDGGGVAGGGISLTRAIDFTAVAFQYFGQKGARDETFTRDGVGLGSRFVLQLLIHEWLNSILLHADVLVEAFATNGKIVSRSSATNFSFIILNVIDAVCSVLPSLLGTNEANRLANNFRNFIVFVFPLFTNSTITPLMVHQVGSVLNRMASIEGDGKRYTLPSEAMEMLLSLNDGKLAEVFEVRDIQRVIVHAGFGHAWGSYRQAFPALLKATKENQYLRIVALVAALESDAVCFNLWAQLLATNLPVSVKMLEKLHSRKLPLDGEFARKASRVGLAMKDMSSKELPLGCAPSHVEKLNNLLKSSTSSDTVSKTIRQARSSAMLMGLLEGEKREVDESSSSDEVFATGTAVSASVSKSELHKGGAQLERMVDERGSEPRFFSLPHLFQVIIYGVAYSLVIWWSLKYGPHDWSKTVDWTLPKAAAPPPTANTNPGMGK